MNSVQRGLIYLAVPAIVVVLSYAVISSGLPLRSLLAAANSLVFTNAALAISVLALRHGDVGRVLLLGVVLSVVQTVLLVVFSDVLRVSWMLGVLGFWHAALLVSGRRVARLTGRERLGELDVTVVILTLPLMVPLTWTSLWLAAGVVTSTYDNYFYVFDGLLPFSIARAVVQFCARHQWAWNACTIVYGNFLFVLCVFIVLRWRRDGEGAGQVLGRWIAAAMVGFALYYLLPGVGPDTAFYGASRLYLESLPSAPEHVELTLRHGFAGWPRNAMPSLHTAWALLLAFVSLDMSIRARGFAALNLVGTVLATLGLREHYLIDLIVALPFAIAVHAGMAVIERTGSRRAQFIAALGGTAMTFGWLLVIRYGTASLRGTPALASCLVLVTVLVSIWLIFRCEAERRAAPSERPSAGTLSSTTTRTT